MTRDSISHSVTQQVIDGEGRFFRKQDFTGPERAVETVLSRLAASGELIRVRRGLYFRGYATEFGMLGPRLLDTAFEIAGPGAGPAQTSAARWLGLTTQVPSIETVAVPGRVPEPIPGVRFRSRPVVRRDLGLTTTEVAVLEVCRDPMSCECGLGGIASKVARLAGDGTIRPDVLRTAASLDPSIRGRETWHLIEQTGGLSDA